MTKWLETFKEFWVKKEIDNILTLFSDDVEYWETPFQTLKKTEIKAQWLSVLEWENIKIDFEIFINDSSKGAVKWRFSHKEGSKVASYAGIYLIKLNNQGLCNYFFQVAEGN